MAPTLAIERLLWPSLLQRVFQNWYSFVETNISQMRILWKRERLVNKSETPSSNDCSWYKILVFSAVY